MRHITPGAPAFAPPPPRRAVRAVRAEAHVRASRGGLCFAGDLNIRQVRGVFLDVSVMFQDILMFLSKSFQHVR